MADLTSEKRLRDNERRRQRRRDKTEAQRHADAAQIVADAEVRASDLLKRAEEEAQHVTEKKQEQLALLAAAEKETQQIQSATRAQRKILQSLEEQVRSLQKKLASYQASVKSLLKKFAPNQDVEETALQLSTEGQKRARREKDAARKREAYWKGKENGGEKGFSQVEGTVDEDASPHVEANRSKRRARAIAQYMVKEFTKHTKNHNVVSKKAVMEQFWLHRDVKDFQPSLMGCPKLDRSVAAGIHELKRAYKVVKNARRTDHRATKEAVVSSMAGSSVVSKRYQSSLAKAMGMKRSYVAQAAKLRAQLDADPTMKYPLGKRKTRSDKISPEIRGDVALWWETRSRVSPNKKDEARCRLARNVYEFHRVHWLEDTEVEFFLKFKEWLTATGRDYVLGLRSFQGMKPYYIRTLKDRNVCCCKQHVEMDLLKDALNKYRLHSHPGNCTCACSVCTAASIEDDARSWTRRCNAGKATVKSVRTWCEEILCPREEGEQWHKKDCLAGNCNECGSAKLNTCKEEVSAGTSDDSIEWQSFQYVSLNGQAKKKQTDEEHEAAEKGTKRLRLVYKATSFEEFLAKIKKVMPEFVYHNFKYRWQTDQYKLCMATFPRGTVVSSIDFAENYTFKQQDEVQSQHWDNKQITLLVHCSYRHRDNSPAAPFENLQERDIVADYHFYISDDNEHDTLFVQHCLDKHWHWMRSQGIRCDQHWMWSDGCAAQFKSCRPFYFVSRYFHTYGVQMMWCFHASGHGKGVNDGLGGTIKTAIERAQLKGTHGYVLEDAHSCVLFLREKFKVGSEKEYGGIQEARRFFWEIGKNEVDRTKRWDCETVVGSRALHCFHGFSQTNPCLLKVRELCCFCPACIDQKEEQCQSVPWAGEWKMQVLQPKLPREVQSIVEQMGDGTGFDEIESGLIGDYVEQGQFFACEAIIPNEWNADFYIMLCTQPMRVVKKRYTDSFGMTFKQGDKVIKGLWYRQWGTVETCFILEENAPDSWVHAQSVVHSRFGLKPTGTIKNAKSFTLKKSTLEAIMTSLKRYGTVENDD